MKTIAHIHTDFPSKFGIPRQSGLVQELTAQIIFEPEYRNPDAFHGLEDFSHIWLIWEFSEAKRNTWSATVRPPRLGGNVRMGVFATRAPYRPNAIGLSCVRLEKVQLHPELGPVLHVRGADLMDNTPIFDIKPYLPYADAHPEATGGFTDLVDRCELTVDFPENWRAILPENQAAALQHVLAQDPRPQYQDDPSRIYGMEFAGYDVHFCVHGDVLTVCDIVKCEQRKK